MKNVIRKFLLLTSIALIAMQLVSPIERDASSQFVVSSSKSSNDDRVTLFIDEPQMSKKQLNDAASFVVVGELTNIKERTVRTILSDPDDPESQAAKEKKKIEVEAPVIIYNLKIEEVFKGESKTKNIDLVIPDMNNIFINRLKEGKRYKFYLYLNPFYGNSTYGLVSFSQGFEVSE